jgi:hypothetical protein
LVKTTLLPAVRTTTGVGTTVDTLGYESALVILHAGVQSGTSTTFAVQECETDVDGSFTDVVAADLDTGAVLAAITTANDESIFSIGYKGSMRYLRVKITANSSGNMLCSATIVLGHPRTAPVTNT